MYVIDSDLIIDELNKGRSSVVTKDRIIEVVDKNKIDLEKFSHELEVVKRLLNIKEESNTSSEEEVNNKLLHEIKDESDYPTEEKEYLVVTEQGHRSLARYSADMSKLFRTYKHGGFYWILNRPTGVYYNEIKHIKYWIDLDNIIPEIDNNIKEESIELPFKEESTNKNTSKVKIVVEDIAINKRKEYKKSGKYEGLSKGYREYNKPMMDERSSKIGLDKRESRNRYTMKEDDLIMNEQYTAEYLAKLLHRSIPAIYSRRYVLNKKKEEKK